MLQQVGRAAENTHTQNNKKITNKITIPLGLSGCKVKKKYIYVIEMTPCPAEG